MRIIRDKLLEKSLPRYCCMLIAASFAGTISSFVDGCITGKLLGADAMASFGVAMPFILVIVVVGGIVLSTGGSICASRNIGKGDIEKARTGFTACCLMGLLLGTLSLIICLFFPEQLISLTGEEGVVAEGAVMYMKGFALGAIPTVLLSIMMAYANVDGNENHCLIAVVIMTVTDIALDILLGVKLNMGLLGMALATSISYLLAIIYFLWVFLSGKSLFSFKNGEIFSESKNIIKFGYPSALNTLLVSARCFFINIILLSIAGSDGIGAFSFQSNFNQFFIAIASGIGISVSTLTGVFIGESDKHKAKATAKIGITYGVIASIVFGTALFLLSDELSKAFLSGSADGIAYAATSLRFFSISLPLSIICIVLIDFYQTLGDRKLANTIAILHGLVWPLFFAYILPPFVGLNGVWLSTAVAEFLTLVCVALYSFFRKDGKHNMRLIFLDDSLCPDHDCVFRVQEQFTDKSLLSISDRYSTLLSTTGKSHDAATSVSKACQTISGHLNNVQLSGEIIDFYGYSDKNRATINIRVSGNKADKAIADLPVSEDSTTFSHHCSANISFIQVCTGGTMIS